MILIELFAPAGVLDQAQREEVGRRLVDALMGTEDSHAQAVMDSARALTQVLVHEPAAWITGDRRGGGSAGSAALAEPGASAEPGAAADPGDLAGAADPSDPPRYLVRVTAPAAWRKEMSAHAVDRLTQALCETEAAAGRDPDRLRDRPHALIHVVGVAEGSLGLYGRPMGSLDLIRHLTAPHRDTVAHLATDGLPPGTVIDPVCGMTVELATTDLTLEVDGTVHGFCNGQCRRIFADEHGIPLGA